MKPTATELLDAVPDFTNWEAAFEWIQKGQRVFQESPLNAPTEKTIASLEWSEIEEHRPAKALAAQEPGSSLFGLYSSQNWRKFVLATFLADLISYPAPVDQVNFDRLLFVMHAFPQGFRVWWIRLPDQSWWPAGYSGWYPMLETTFELFEKCPEKLRDRMVVPTHLAKGEGNANAFLYLFNYSVAPQFRSTCLTKKLMSCYSRDIRATHPIGLSCITVSEDGARVAGKFGMSCSGSLQLNGTIENVYVKRS